MKKFAPMLLATAVLVAGTFFATKAVFAAEESPMILRHVVLFKFKAEATKEQIKSVEDAFAALPSKIPQVQHLEWGTDVSPEKLAHGYTHCFLGTFKTAEDRDAYLVHPDHKEFGKLVGPLLDGVTVVDFWTKP